MERPRSSWVVELNIAGCTIRRRAARRRNLLPLPAWALPAGELHTPRAV